MGGTKEDTISQSKSVDKLGGKIGKKLRFHESNGEAHFHDDENNLKVAVPVATWFSAWQKLSTEMGDWSYIDAGQGTILNISVFQKKDKVRTNINIQTVETDDVYSKLQKFTTSQ
jgi:hypothetical protein